MGLEPTHRAFRHEYLDKEVRGVPALVQPIELPPRTDRNSGEWELNPCTRTIRAPLLDLPIIHFQSHPDATYCPLFAIELFPRDH